jgi:hypothetical protein
MEWGILVPIVAVGGGVAYDIVDRLTKYKEKQIGIATDAAAERAAQYAAKTERLEQRMAVLERIITDRSAGLADEIDRLRDRPLN